LLKKIGRGSKIDQNVTMRRPSQISIGSHVSIAYGVTINIKDNGEEILLGDCVQVGENTIFSCIGGVLDVGRKTVIGKQCRLGSKKGLKIGKSCQIGHFTYIVGASHAHQRTDVPIIDQEITCKGASCIGDNVIIGDNVTLLDGIQIGDHVQIESGSLVTQDIENGAQVAGVPARNLTKKS
jgi:acetyltransferase-like isoleucine patch superfamily enzyme